MGNSYMNDQVGPVIEYNRRRHEEYIKCSTKPYSRPWQAEYRECEYMRIEDSSDFFKIISFPSLESLEKLCIVQNQAEAQDFVELRPGFFDSIPSSSLRKVEVSCQYLKFQSLRNLLDQLQKQNSASTCVNISCRELRSVPVNVLTDWEQACPNPIYSVGKPQMAGKHLMLKFDGGNKQLNLFIEKLIAESQ